MKAFFSTVKNKVGEWFESYRDAKVEVFDYIEGFYNQRPRRSSEGRRARQRSNDRRLTQRN
jgi:hypothetical protein